MKVFLVLDSRFVKNIHNGKVFALESPGSYYFFEGFLKVFDEVNVIARLRDGETNENLPLANGDRVLFYPLPDFHGPVECFLKLPTLLRKLWNVSGEEGAFVLRIPSGIGVLLWIMLKIRNKPYAVKLVGFPESLFTWKASGSVIIHLFFMPLLVILTKMQCAQAIAVAYVTTALQKRYPPKRAKIVTSYSDITISIKHFSPTEKLDLERWKKAKGQFKIVFVGTLARPIKGLDILFKTLVLLLKVLPQIQLWVIGDGKLRMFYKSMAKKLGILDKVTFWGKLNQEEVLKKLQEAHLFVSSSYTEGVPRAMIEAMVMGLPCIGTKVGGVPELLSEETLVPPGDIRALYERLRYLLSHSFKMEKLGVENRYKAISEFHPNIVEMKRTHFYFKIRTFYENLYGRKECAE